MSDDGARAASATMWQELGTLEVADQVFRDLALKASQDVPGVANLARSRCFLRRRWAAGAVQVERGGGEVAFSIHLSARYSVRIPDMADELRRRVTALVEATTGHKVRSINITVEHILPPEARPAAGSGRAVFDPEAEPQAQTRREPVEARQERQKPSGGPPELPKAPAVPDPE